ncbi:LysR family transcriptional regulator [Lactococcus paracarnosus]|uniref:LysR family transcriptional regulator n=1 Tax=Pseudolactococcus paracarnosus TaxID=2749962 RepID=A0A7L4WFG7_9LACT|nr:LysR family transcriptional regulator [Lactococcus paracarnosus]SPC37280.1 Cysteine and methionine metabolism regulator CmbR, LysR family [Lactococcus piscium]MCJ1977801.1 LysR family transcriptional regulator [Lactococcus paracarnosus]MCJ1983886.1 LysR family transcriptional regulator [Lactococcus paracarnosus]MCJ1993307.1 LysR family transcriptional regulator [Lactococcus paracarnosus]MCJ1999147.1 LysR family transcriptional regulator [Lactococcus paracarnosus]
MNIKQLRYIVAIANTGTFREASEQLYVSQPSMSIAVKDLEVELGFKIFDRLNTGVSLTIAGERFYEQAQSVLRDFDTFEAKYMSPATLQHNFSIASQHYDFLAPVSVEFSEKNPDIKNIRLFESTTYNILTEVSDGVSDVGIAYLNNQNRLGITRMLDKLDLDFDELMTFKTHIYLRQSHPLASKAFLTNDDLRTLSRVRFTQENEQFLYYSEDLVETFENTKIFNVTDRASLNGILERTDAYATGSGFIDQASVHGIKVIPLEDGNANTLIFIKKKSSALSEEVKSYKRSLENYFAQNQF